MNLQMKLNELWAGIIENFEFNFLKHAITLKIKTIDNGIEKKYNVVFGEVASHFFLENKGQERLNLVLYDEGDYLELTSIDYYEGGVGNIIVKSSHNWAEQYYSSANFILEIWNSMLFVEARVITINGEVFEIDYPREVVKKTNIT